MPDCYPCPAPSTLLQIRPGRKVDSKQVNLFSTSRLGASGTASFKLALVIWGAQIMLHHSPRALNERGEMPFIPSFDIKPRPLDTQHRTPSIHLSIVRPGDFVSPNGWVTLAPLILFAVTLPLFSGHSLPQTPMFATLPSPALVLQELFSRKASGSRHPIQNPINFFIWKTSIT